MRKKFQTFYKHSKSKTVLRYIDWFRSEVIANVWILPCSGYSFCCLEDQKSHVWDALNLSTCAENYTYTNFFLKFLQRRRKKIMFHLSLVTCHLSLVTFHLTTNLCSFSFYESPRRFGHAFAGGLGILE